MYTLFELIHLIVMVSIIPALLILPGWHIARRWQVQSAWLFGLPFAANALWVALTIMGVGAQSLANLIELLVIAIVAVLAPYLKFFLIDRRIKVSALGNIFVVVLVILVTLGLRLLMPVLPE